MHPVLTLDEHRAGGSIIRIILQTESLVRTRGSKFGFSTSWKHNPTTWVLGGICCTCSAGKAYTWLNTQLHATSVWIPVGFPSGVRAREIKARRCDDVWVARPRPEASLGTAGRLCWGDCGPIFICHGCREDVIRHAPKETLKGVGDPGLAQAKSWLVASTITPTALRTAAHGESFGHWSVHRCTCP